MSTLVMVEKDGVACIAAETLTTYGSLKKSARYLESSEKIFRVGDTYIGSVGWTVYQTVLRSAFENGLELPAIRNKTELFEFSLKLHKKLKRHYFLKEESDGDGFESTQMTLFLMNRFGLFGLFSNRSVEQYRRFSAVGSGEELALGAMYAAYELDASAEDIARLGVEAGAEFDRSSLGPIALKKLKLEA